MLCSTHRGLLTAADVAERYGVSERSVRTWCREGCPTVARGWQGKAGPLFDAGAVDDWIEARMAQHVKLSAALCRKLDAQATKEAKVLAGLARDYLPADEVHRGGAAFNRMVQRRLNRIPAELAVEVMQVVDAGPAGVADIVNAHVRQVLTELAEGPIEDIEPSAYPVPVAPPVSSSTTVREARAHQATLQAHVIETRNRTGHYPPGRT